MPSAFDLIGRNPALQEHWIRRLFAFLIDSVVVFGIVWFVYSMLLEGLVGGTIGKKLLSLRVVALDGNLDVVHTIIRNLSKVYWLVFLIDLLLGAATHGDPRQRYFDRLARTTVTQD